MAQWVAVYIISAVLLMEKQVWIWLVPICLFSLTFLSTFPAKAFKRFCCSTKNLQKRTALNTLKGWSTQKWRLCHYLLTFVSFQTCMHFYLQENTKIYIYISGGPLSALTCCVNVRPLSAIKKISPLIYSQSWVGSWVYTTQAMMTFTLIF